MYVTARSSKYCSSSGKIVDRIDDVFAYRSRNDSLCSSSRQDGAKEIELVKAFLKFRGIDVDEP